MRGRIIRGAETAAAAAAWALVVAGVSLALLTLPAFTSGAERALGIPTSAGLPVADALHLANAARAYVADLSYGPLPATWKGRSGFDAASVSHLRDVRALMDVARDVTGIAAISIAAWLGVCIGRRRWDALRAGMRWGAFAIFGLFGVAALLGLADFESLFVRFHEVLFPMGNWTFPAGSMLIRLFPERFWIACAATWAALAAASATLLLGASSFVPRADRRASASQEGENV